MYFWLNFSLILICFGIIVDGFLQLEKTNELMCKFVENYQPKMSKKSNTILAEISNLLKKLCENELNENEKIKLNEILRKYLQKFSVSKELKNEWKKNLKNLRNELEELEENGKIEPNLVDAELNEEREIFTEIEIEKEAKFRKIKIILEEFLMKKGIQKIDQISNKEIIELIIKIALKFMENEENLVAEVLKKHNQTLVFDPLGISKNGRNGLGRRKKRQNDAADGFLGMSEFIYVIFKII